MSVFFSCIIVLLLINKSFVSRFVVKEKQDSLPTKLFIDLFIFLFIAITLGSIIHFFVYKFILFPIKLTILLFLLMPIVAFGITWLFEFMLIKMNKLSLLTFKKYELSALLYIGFLLITQVSNSVITSVLLPIINVCCSFFVGIILIDVCRIITKKTNAINKFSIILIVSSIVLMLSYVM